MDVKINTEIISCVHNLTINCDPETNAKCRKYLFMNFEDFSTHEKDYIKATNQVLYKRLVGHMHKNLNSLLDKQKLIYPPPVFNVNEITKFNRYFGFLLEKEETEQIKFYCKEHEIYVVDYLIHNKTISPINAVTVLENLKSPHFFNIIYVLEWPGAPEYYKRNIEKYKNIDPNSLLTKIKKNKEVIMAFYECKFNFSLYSCDNPNLEKELTVLANSIKKELNLIDFLITKKEDFLKVLSLPYQGNHFVFQLLNDRNKMSEANNGLHKKLIQNYSDFCLSLVYNKKKYGNSYDYNLIDYCLLNDKTQTLIEVTKLIHLLNDKDKIKIYNFNYTMFLKTGNEEHLKHIALPELKRIREENKTPITSEEAKIILEKYLLTSDLAKVDKASALHKI